MFRLFVVACILGVVLGAPATPADKPSLEELRAYLEKVTAHNVTTTLEEAMVRSPWASAWENSGKYQGDILLRDQEVEEIMSEYSGDSSSRTGLVNTWNRWPGNTIIWDFAAGHFTAAQQNQIRAAFDMFHTRTCIRFRQRTNERDYVLVTGRADGCYAHVGYWPNFGAHTLNLAPNGCLNHFIIIHEWLHVVGFQHMHQTYNRYDWIWINWQNVQSGLEYAFTRYTNSEVTMLGLPYEYASNMHYGSHAFSRNGQPTIGARWAGGDQMGQLAYVTGYDILRINRLYNCPGAWSTTINREDANQPAYTYVEKQSVEDVVNDNVNEAVEVAELA